ncbi:hypothetical protein MKW98_026694 [Papaver atlanticum]|uniref:Uncharacterized protein n=1 Tax=Papaver atlanticum TaxID=357466 RepID=A0AAD4RZU5_9MAGN|nr:hypothetical protein MKW98_026694 [Papaver atlanticum]
MHYAAAAVGRVNALKYLIKDMKLYVDFIDNTGETPLSWAAIYGCLAVMDYLLKIGANPEIPDDSNSSPLHHAAIPTDVGIKPLLLSEGINVDFTNELGSLLQYDVSSGKHGTAQVLLDHGANVKF